MSDFSPGQIVYLEHQGDRLYGEIIQVVPQRRMIWLRPLFLTTAKGVNANPVPLDGTIDLLWPLDRFRAALDTDTLPLLATLQSKQENTLEDPQAHRQRANQLRQFIERLWRDEGLIFTTIASG